MEGGGEATEGAPGLDAGLGGGDERGGGGRGEGRRIVGEGEGVVLVLLLLVAAEAKGGGEGGGGPGGEVGLWFVEKGGGKIERSQVLVCEQGRGEEARKRRQISTGGLKMGWTPACVWLNSSDCRQETVGWHARRHSCDAGALQNDAQAEELSHPKLSTRCYECCLDWRPVLSFIQETYLAR